MVDGVNIYVGDHAVKHVVMDIKQDIDIAIIQSQNMEVLAVMVRVNKLADAILDLVLVSNIYK